MLSTDNTVLETPRAGAGAVAIVGAAPDAVTVSSHPNAWLLIWTAMLVVNGGCCLVVWANGLGADPVRQVLALSLAALSAVLAWRRKTEPQEHTNGTTFLVTHTGTAEHVNYRGTILLVAACATIFLAGNFHVTRMFLFANIALIIGFVWTYFGWQRCKSVAPAAFLSLFALPDLPEEFRAYLFIPLQHICTITAGELAKLFVPLTHSGHMFTVDGHQFDVAPSCAGLGMWACFLFAFAIWQGFKKYRPSAYLAALIMDPVLVLTLNTVRIALTAIIAHYHSMRLALQIHSNLELVLVPLGLFILWKVGAHFAEKN